MVVESFVEVENVGRVHKPEWMVASRTLYESNPDHSQFSFKVFNKHIHQEVRTQKWYNYRSMEKKKKKKKKTRR